MTTAPHRHVLPRPILFHVGRWPVASYTAMLYAGCVLGVEAGALLARSAGRDPDRVALATVVLIVPALIGSRLLFVAQHAALYRAAPSRIWRRRDGGSALFGGLALALVVSVPVLHAFDLPFLGFWDSGAITMAVGNVLTRVGCHLTGCCAGRPTDGRLGFELPDRAGVRVRRVPVQLIESAWTSIVVVIALVARRVVDADGAVFATVVALYGSGRLAIEGLRERDGGRSLGAINAVIAGGLVVSGVAILTGAR